MKKRILFVFILAITLVSTINLSAANRTVPTYRDVDMKANGTWYTFKFPNGNSTNKVFGRLTNLDDDYGTSYFGYGKVRLREANDGKWDIICTNQEYLSPNGDYTQCNDNWNNKNEYFKTQGAYDYAETDKFCSTLYGIWSRLT